MLLGSDMKQQYTIQKVSMTLQWEEADAQQDLHQ